MDHADTFEAWAPSGGRWTPWAKRVLFTQVEVVEPALPELPTWVREELFVVGEDATDYRSSARPAVSALVVDLPGAEGVAVGVALAGCGFRPVPLYDALGAPGAVVPMFDVARALVAGAIELRRAPPPVDAPPAFLVDSRRAGEGVPVTAGMFDNRSVLYPADFPPAERLREQGVRGAVLIQSGTDGVRRDLARVLEGWQRGGLALAAVRADAPAVAAPMTVRAGLGATLAWWWERAFLRGDRRRGFGGYKVGETEAERRLRLRLRRGRLGW